MYLQAAAFFGVDWKQATALFQQVAGGWPALSDGTMNATQRYHESLMRYGDQLWHSGDACEAYAQYQTAMGLGNLDDQASKNANQAFQQCYPPTEVPTEVPTLEAPTAEVPTATP